MSIYQLLCKLGLHHWVLTTVRYDCDRGIGILGKACFFCGKTKEAGK